MMLLLCTSSQVGDLSGHLKTHCGEESNKCGRCDSASSEADGLRAHLKLGLYIRGSGKKFHPKKVDFDEGVCI